MGEGRRGIRALDRVARAVTRWHRWVLAGWVVAAALLTVAVPSLEKVVSHDATPFLPSSSPSLRAFAQMDRAFGEGSGRSIAFVVVAHHGFAGDQQDQRWYADLVRRLHADRAHVADLQDYVAKPQLKAALTSRDGDTTYLPVALRHPVGSPTADSDVTWLRQQTAQGRPPGVSTAVTGDVASIADLNAVAQESIARVTVVSVVIIIVILLLLYRSLLLPLVPLATIGIGLMVARGLVALFGQSFLPVSTYTGTFVTALVLGAGTDYTVFLISRFHESMQDGESPDGAIAESLRRIGPVVIASGLTVIIGSACMVLAKLALFGTTGPAIAVSVLVTLVVGLTFTPALLALLGDRARPRRVTTRSTSRWAAVGALVSRHPVRLIAASVALLATLAAFYPTMRPSYSTGRLVPASAESSRGYALLHKHFPGNELRPDYLLVTSGHDLRNPRDLAVLDQVAAAVGKVDGVTAVRGFTRPQGRPLDQAQLGRQLATVGAKLHGAGQQLTGPTGVDRLADGADALAGGAGRLSTGATRATDAVDLFLSGLDREYDGLGTAAGGAGSAATGAGRLRDGAHALADALHAAHDQTQPAVDGLGAIYAALSADPTCTTVDQICNTSRINLGRIYTAERDRLLPGLDRAARAADRIAAGDGRLAAGLDDLRDGIVQAQSGIRKLSEGEREFQRRLGQLAGGAGRLAAGAAQVPAGVDKLQSAAARLRAGLDQASSYLSGTADATTAAGISAFYLPASALDDPRLATARAYYLSGDGRTARLLVFTRDDQPRIAAERRAADSAVAGTPLASAAVTVTGPTAVAEDLHHISDDDLRLVALVTLATVFLILVLLLRALVAPLYLLASVVLSYAAAMGISTLVWQDLLGRPLDFTVPLMSFVLLVAVGADYNILLMSRVREESAQATRRGVARAVTATGGVITSAGLIFAGTFVAMTTSPMLGIVEAGFTIAVGLMLDTFVVRSLLVPSVAVLLGRLNWWPTGRRGELPVTLSGLRRQVARVVPAVSRRG